MSLVIFLLLVPQFALSDVNQGKITIDCYCTDTYGQRVELGESVCLFVDGRSFVAKCEMALNNPIWRDTGENCLVSRSEPAEQPVGSA